MIFIQLLIIQVVLLKIQVVLSIMQVVHICIMSYPHYVDNFLLYIDRRYIEVRYICYLYMFFVLYPEFFRSGQNHNFILCSIFLQSKKRHIFIEYDIFSGFSLWGIFYIFLVYFYSEILLMLSRHTFYFISTLPNKKSIKNYLKYFGKLFGNLPILLPKY